MDRRAYCFCILERQTQYPGRLKINLSYKCNFTRQLLRFFMPVFLRLTAFVSASDLEVETSNKIEAPHGNEGPSRLLAI